MYVNEYYEHTQNRITFLCLVQSVQAGSGANQPSVHCLLGLWPAGIAGDHLPPSISS